jgi:hypothetical protein
MSSSSHPAMTGEEVPPNSSQNFHQLEALEAIVSRSLTGAAKSATNIASVSSGF